MTSNSTRHCVGTHATVRSTKATFVTSAFRVKRFLTWVISKWKHVTVTFHDEEDEDILAEE